MSVLGVDCGAFACGDFIGVTDILDVWETIVVSKLSQSSSMPLTVVAIIMASVIRETLKAPVVILTVWLALVR